MGQTNKAIIRKYLIQCITAIVLYFIIVILSCVLLQNIWALLIGIALYIPLRISIKAFARNNFLNIIFKEANSTKFKNIILNNRYFIPPISYKIYASYYSGDYSTTINICQTMLKKTKSQKATCSYLTIMAHTYFENNDYENLEKVCQDFENLYENKEKFEKAKKQNPTIVYYQKFLEVQYDWCIETCKANTSLNGEKSAYGKVPQIYALYNLAKVLYVSGDKNEAKEYFKLILELAPNLNISKIANNYLNAINNSEELTLDKTEIIIQENYKLYDEKTIVRIKKQHIISCIAVVLLFCSLGLYVLLKDKFNNQSDEFKTKICMALDEKYGEYELLTYFDVKKDDKTIDTICVIEANDEIDVLSCITHGDEDVSLILYIIDASFNNPYCVKSIGSDYYIGFTVYDSYSEVPQRVYNTFEIDINGTIKYFCVNYVETTPQ